MPELDSQHPEPAALAGFACGSLPVERAETVANHVAGCTVCAAAVEASTDRVIETLNEVLRTTDHGESEATAAFPRSAAFPLPAAPRQSKYQDFMLLGIGGMGLVFKAWEPAAERFVALKIIQPDLTGHAAAQSRLLREAKALRQLNHPNIVGIYDVEAIDDLIVIVMEYLDGHNLLQPGTGRPLVGWPGVPVYATGRPRASACT